LFIGDIQSTPSPGSAGWQSPRGGGLSPANDHRNPGQKTPPGLLIRDSLTATPDRQNKNNQRNPGQTKQKHAAGGVSFGRSNPVQIKPGQRDRINAAGHRVAPET